jgi:uncharacterized protein (DUF1697 family)
MTSTYAALLRGINVGGRNKVPMAELRTLLAGLGLGGVRTHLQSGNAVFTSQDDDAEAVRALVEGAIEERFGFRVGCVVRDGAYLRAVVDGCPFPADTLAAKQLHATYFSERVDPERFAALDADAYLPEAFRLGDRVLYLCAPDGLGRSRLAEALRGPSESTGAVATSRNWNTVLKLVELTHG